MAIIQFLEMFWNDLFRTFIEFLYAPIIFREMLGILLPVALAILLMELYFRRYPRESIGHHKSLENAIFLLFISFDLIRFIFTNSAVTLVKVYICIFFTLFAAIIAFMDFFHQLSISVIFKTSSKFIVAFLSYIVIILMYSDLLNNTSILHIVSVILAIILLFFTLIMIKNVMFLLEPKSYEEIEYFLRNIEEDIRKASQETETEFKRPPKIEKIIKKKKKST